ncbi:hypothetical protein OH782_41335 (plasmid) [Streptomyces sp. NBC_01544]|uniref:hypothetical protein n=1 Tax=Streptomyces sp. NBC_01544 TaxID=2975871 RepID=UPI002F91BAAE
MTGSPTTHPGLIRTRVTLDGPRSYAAVLNPSNRWNGFVSPLFTLDTVRQLATDTQTMATEYGHDCADTVHVIDGGTDTEGAPVAVVLHIRWQYIEEGPAEITSIITPTTDRLYGIGGWEWTWSIATWECACGRWIDHHITPCTHCGRDRTDDFALAA